MRDALAPVYKQMKDRSGKIRLLMITGVSKFTKLSINLTMANRAPEFELYWAALKWPLCGHKGGPPAVEAGAQSSAGKMPALPGADQLATNH